MHTFLENVARHGNLYMPDSDEINYGHALRRKSTQHLACAIVMKQSAGNAPNKPNATILAVSSDFPAITRPWKERPDRQSSNRSQIVS
jgi:hypothetical protein